MIDQCELLAPAGDMEKLMFALHYGADAAYCSGKRFGLRAFAGNFSIEDLADAVAYTHSLGKKIYVTLNMYPHNADLEGIEDYLAALEEIQPDALLVADPGVFNIIQQQKMTVPVHISTQATVVNWSNVAFWANQPNVERVVLARELSLNEIDEIRAKTNIQIEAFVHGAMCMSYSGRCLLSNYMTGRDANRGECAQPCRWHYSLVEEKRPGEYYPIEEDAHGSYIFNSHDLCTLPVLDRILSHHIDSLKIEGRMKSLYYVATIVRCYRHVIDVLENDGCISADELSYWIDDMEKISHRPYSTGFFFGRPEDNALNNSSSAYIKPYDFVGIVREYNAYTGIATIEQRNKVSVGDTVQFFGPDYKERDFLIENMTSERGESILSAPHAQERYHLKLPFEVAPMDLLRMKIK